MREIFVGVAGSAAVLAVDLFVVRWSDDSNGTRLLVAVAVFVLAFTVAKFLPRRDKPIRNVLSGNEINGAMTVDVTEISTTGVENLLSTNTVRGDLNVKSDKIIS